MSTSSKKTHSSLREAYNARKQTQSALLREATVRYLEEKYVSLEEIAENPSIALESVTDFDKRLFENVKLVPVTLKYVTQLWKSLSESVVAKDAVAVNAKTLNILATLAAINESLTAKVNKINESVSDDDKIVRGIVEKYVSQASLVLPENITNELTGLSPKSALSLTLGVGTVKKPISLSAVKQHMIVNEGFLDYFKSGGENVEKFNGLIDELRTAAQKGGMKRFSATLTSLEQQFEQVVQKQEANQKTPANKTQIITTMEAFGKAFGLFFQRFGQTTANLNTFRTAISTKPLEPFKKSLASQDIQNFVRATDTQFKAAISKALPNATLMRSVYTMVPKMANLSMDMVEDIIDMTPKQLSDVIVQVGGAPLKLPRITPEQQEAAQQQQTPDAAVAQAGQPAAQQQAGGQATGPKPGSPEAAVAANSAKPGEAEVSTQQHKAIVQGLLGDIGDEAMKGNEQVFKWINSWVRKLPVELKDKIRAELSPAQGAEAQGGNTSVNPLASTTASQPAHTMN